LAEDILLGDDFLRQLMSVGEVDLLVAIPINAGALSVFLVPTSPDLNFFLH